MDTPWIQVPTREESAVPRPRVDAALDAACVAAPVVTVVAGAGYGKTSALSAWASRERARRPVAWIDARMAVRAPGGLWQWMWLACREALTEAGDPDVAADDVGTHAAGPHQVLELLGRSELRPVLIVDDLHEVRDPAVFESIDLLIAYLPPGTNLIVASRWDPPLRLAELRLRGELAELGADDLAFDAAGTVRLLAARPNVLDDATIDRLVGAVDGWPVALRVAASAVAAGADVEAALDELSTDGSGLARYVAAEVLDRLPAAWREVLTAVSIDERCHADLAVALTDIADAGAILHEVAARSGLFHPVPDAPGWLEPHALARSFLRVELQATRGGEVGELHHRAARWFADRGHWGSAMEHALQDPDRRCLRDLVEQVGVEPLVRSTPKGQQVAALISRTMPSRWPVGRELALAVAVLANADAQVAYGISEPLRLTTFDDASDERLRVIAVARVWRNLARFDLAWAVLEEASWEGASTDELVLLRSEQVLAGCGGAGYAEIGRHAADVLAQAEACGADRILVHLRVALAALALIDGAPRVAQAHADAASQLGARFGTDLAIPLAEIGVVEAAIALELGVDEQLGSVRLAPLTTPTRAGPVHLRLGAEGADLRRRWTQGDDPRQLLLRVADVLNTVELEAADPGFLVSMIQLELLLAEAAQDLGRAESAVGRLPRAHHDLPEAAYLRAHLLRLRRSYAQARRELRPLVRAEVTPIWPATRLWGLALDGVLAHLQGAPDTGSLEEAVEIATVTGRKRPFIELGAQAHATLVARRDSLPADGTIVDELIATLESRMLAAPAEPLTEAEVKVLRRLGSMATLQEIADGLHLSRNTVKTHTSSIYRKLGVCTRREAVGRGRQLGLLRVATPELDG